MSIESQHLSIDTQVNVQAQWYLPNDRTYLLNHAVGLLPRSSKGLLDQLYFEPWRQGEEAWPSWLSVLERFQRSLASLLGGQPDHFCPQSNISSALTKLLQSYEYAPGRNTILLSEDDFPTIGFVAQHCPELKIVFIPKGLPTEDVSVWQQYLTDDIGIVLITEAQSSTGRLVPVKEVTALASKMAIFSIVDVAQSAGIVPIQIDQWSADAVIGSCVKWLCGGPGAGFLWVSPTRLKALYPQDVGWFSHQNPFEFDIHHFEFAASAQRFLGGTPSIAPFVLATNGIEQILSIGIAGIRSHNIQARDILKEYFQPSDWVSPEQPKHHNGSLIIRASKKNIAFLERNAIAYDQRPGGIRLSPHIYNALESLSGFA